MIGVLQKVGSEHILVVHSEDGLDEISICGPTHVRELKNGDILEYKISPEEMGLRRHSLEAIRGDDQAANAQAIRDVFDCGNGAKQDITALNAGAAVYVAGKSPSLKEGVALAMETIRSGAAKRKLRELVEFTRSCSAN